MTDPSDSFVTWTAEGPAFLVRLANPPANQLGDPLLDGLSAAVGAFETSAARTLIIHSGLDGFFAAGALAIGLLDRVAEPGGALKQALELAGQFGAMSRPALAAVLRSVDEAAELPLAE